MVVGVQELGGTLRLNISLHVLAIGVYHISIIVIGGYRI